MADARTLRSRLRDLTDRIAAMASGRTQPADLGRVLVYEAERRLVEGPAGPTIPNVFAVSIGETLDGPDRAAVARRLQDVVAETAFARGWRFDGPIRVTLSPGGRSAQVETAVERGDLPAWAVLTSAADDHPLPVRPNRAVVGRSREADVIVETTGVSRRHALLWREAGRVWIADFQSANGTFVNGDPVYDVVEVRRADMIQFGDAGFVFGMA